MGRCRWIEDPTMPDGKWFMPECMGGAVGGEDSCTCLTHDEQEETISDLKEEIGRLRKRIRELSAKRIVK